MNKLIILFLLIPLSGFAKQKDIIITGKIHEPQSKTIKFLVNNLFSDNRTIYTKRIDRGGNFTLEYNQFYPHDNYIKYNDKLYTYYAAPGDSLHMEIKNNSIVFAGNHSTLNNEIQTFQIRKRFEYWDKVNKAQHELSPMEYKKELFSIQSESDSLMNVFFKKHQSSLELQEWAHYYYRYRIIDDLMRYKMFNPEKEIPEEYYDFLGQSDFLFFQPKINAENNFPSSQQPIDTKAFMCSRANDAVNEVFIYLLQQIAESNPEIQRMKDLKQGYEIVLNRISGYTDGTMKEILMVKLFHQMIKWKQFDFIEDNLSVFFLQVKNDNLRSIIMESYGRKKKEIKSNRLEQYLSYYTNNDIISSVIDSILIQNPSKVIYIDFWGTWCSPCLNEMPHANKLKLSYVGEDIEFVYLCVRSPEKEWKEKIRELKIDGKHFLLTQDEFNILSEIFQIDGIPHYVLINKSGKIIEKQACCPSDPYLEVQIDRLLNK